MLYLLVKPGKTLFSLSNIMYMRMTYMYVCVPFAEKHIESEKCIMYCTELSVWNCAPVLS